MSEVINAKVVSDDPNYNRNSNGGGSSSHNLDTLNELIKDRFGNYVI
jgi:hypothetical protein